jgi:hypothetical protein
MEAADQLEEYEWELNLLRNQVRELRHARDHFIQYLERECGGRCNAEYNPCSERYLLNKMYEYYAEDNSPVPDWSEHGFVEEKR